MFGVERGKKNGSDGRSALDQAAGGPEDHGLLGNSATRMIQSLLEVGIDGRGPFASAADVAQAARRKHADPEAAVTAIVRDHLKLAAASGFVTSLGGFITLPVSLPVNVTGFYLLATRMTAAVAAVRGYDIANPQIRTAVLLTLVGTDADDLLAKAGMVAPTGKMTNLAAQRLPGPALMVVNKAIGFRLLATAGKSTFSRFGKAVPIVGGAVGAGLDGYLLNRIAGNARGEFPQVALAIEAGPDHRAN